MKHDSPLWKVMGEPASPAEAAALDAFRDLLPDDGITTAWANLTFINDQGRTAEVDVLLLTTQGMYLVELKGWHGTIGLPPTAPWQRPALESWPAQRREPSSCYRPQGQVAEGASPGPVA